MIREKSGSIISARNTLTTTAFLTNIITIEDDAFENTPFQAIIIPSAVTTIGTRAFANCRNLV